MVEDFDSDKYKGKPTFDYMGFIFSVEVAKKL